VLVLTVVVECSNGRAIAVLWYSNDSASNASATLSSSSVRDSSGVSSSSSVLALERERECAREGSKWATRGYLNKK
jgi:hypothetical protein